MLSEHTIQEIKYDGKTPQFMAWLAKTKIFLKSDSLGIDKMTTIGYLMQLHLQYMSQIDLKILLITDITIDADLTMELDPSIKEQHKDAVTNSDLFVPAVLPFELFSHRQDKDKAEMAIIGIKCTIP